MARNPYLTAQCHRCLTWCPPDEFPAHRNICRGRPWARHGDPRTVTAPPGIAGHLAEHLDVGLRSERTIGHKAVLMITSPLRGVPPRLWVRTVEAAIGHGYDPHVTITKGCTIEGWGQLRDQFRVELLACPHCGEHVSERGLQTHVDTSNRCKWIRATDAVTKLRSAGFTDPYSTGGIPNTWTALRAGPWRAATTAVPYPTFHAVLVLTS